MPGLVVQEPMVQTPPWLRSAILINLRTHFRGGEEGVFAAVHRRAAGMRGLAVKRDGVPFDAERAEHRAERQIQIQKHRALLDVQFQIRGGIFQFLAAVLHALEINADIFQRVRQFDSVLVHQAARFVHVEIAGAGGRAEQTFAEARAFFIGPIHEANRHRRLAVVLGIDAAENLHTGQHIEAAIEPAAVRHGIHVAADEQTFFRFAAQRRPGVARGVVVDFDRERFELFPAATRGSSPTSA